ncbi:TPM domain-containing protein [Paraburkholderia aromaticivorans]|uniref:TPM domain-containing protein n=1 Tax=Paraburkholderia aromaticivorans TaxID=2026199 RepID=UPI0038BB7211
MNIKRIVRHLFTTHGKVNTAFPRSTLIAIEKAIKACDAEHVGEVCFAIEGALHSTALFNGQSARDRAVEVFSQLRVWDTEYNNGVLIYVLLADRGVEIVADRGVHAKVGSQEWQAICHTMEEAFRQGEYRDGAISGIQATAQLLKRHFPAHRDSTNELPDTPAIL